MNRQELAALFSNSFQPKKRGKETITVLKEDHPEWMRDAIFQAHEALGGMLPNDWVYEACELAADFLADNDPDEWEDLAGNFADSNVEAYSAQLYLWAADHGNFRALIEEAREEFGPGESHEKEIQIAQYMAYERIYHAIREAIEEQAEEGEDDEK